MKVMVFGSFDGIHEGHRSLFAQAKELGLVIVVVACDASIQRLKKRIPRNTQEERLFFVSKEPLVDKAVLGHTEDFFLVIQEEKPDILLLGYDQTTFTIEEITRELNKRGLHPKILRAHAFKPELYKSSKLYS